HAREGPAHGPGRTGRDAARRRQARRTGALVLLRGGLLRLLHGAAPPRQGEDARARRAHRQGPRQGLGARLPVAPRTRGRSRDRLRRALLSLGEVGLLRRRIGVRHHHARELLDELHAARARVEALPEVVELVGVAREVEELAVLAAVVEGEARVFG